MRALGTIQLILLAGLLFASISGLAASLLLPWVARWTVFWSPASRYRALALVGSAPVVLPAVALGSVLLPSFLGRFWPTFDHCLSHDDDHAHFCLRHLSEHAGGWTGWLIVLLVLGWLAARCAGGAWSLLEGHRLLRRIASGSRYDSARQTWVVPAREQLCLSFGIFRPRLLVSEGLLATLPVEELSVMLAHEQAHNRRKDTLQRLCLRVSGTALFPRARRQLFALLELTSEQACDEAAALHVGDRLRVAETILAMERRLSSLALRTNPAGAAFGGSVVRQRVEAMLIPPRQKSACPLLMTIFGASLATTLLACSPLHDVTESVVAFLNR